MNSFKLLILIPFLFLVLPPSAVAQVAGVEQGDKIRVRAPGVLTAKTTGIVTGITRDSLQFMHRDSSILLSIASIEQLEVSTGQRRYAGRGALIGAGSLGITFGLLAMSSDTDCDNEEGWCIDIFSKKDAFYGGLIAGVLLGSASGAIIGHFTLRDKWENIEIIPVSLAFHSNKSIAAIGIRLRL
jgi:hypothetical protein